MFKNAEFFAVVLGMTVAFIGAAVVAPVSAQAQPGQITGFETDDRFVSVEWEKAPGDTLTPAQRDTLLEEFFGGYRVWRSSTPDPESFTLLRTYSLFDSTWTFKGDERAFADPDSIIPRGNDVDPDFETIPGPFNGFEYYYAITWFNAFLDLSLGIPRPVEIPMQTVAEGIFDQPIVPSRPARTETPLLGEVAVVPNPYNPGGSFGQAAFTGEARVQFINLPQTCTIDIYTVDGSKVRTLEHAAPVDHEFWDLRNADGKDVASGIYLFYVTGSGRETRGRFVIVR